MRETGMIAQCWCIREMLAKCSGTRQQFHIHACAALQDLHLLPGVLLCFPNRESTLAPSFMLSICTEVTQSTVSGLVTPWRHSTMSAKRWNYSVWLQQTESQVSTRPWPASHAKRLVFHWGRFIFYNNQLWLPITSHTSASLNTMSKYVD